MRDGLEVDILKKTPQYIPLVYLHAVGTLKSFNIRIQD